MPVDAVQRERRLELIRRLLRREAVGSQGAILRALRQRGHSVTQSSVSRDLQTLGVTKVDGRYRLPRRVERDAPETPPSVASMMRDVRPAGPHLLVVRTVVGGAPRVGLWLDACGWPEIVGTVAGDDTLFVATGGRREQARLEKRLQGLAAVETRA